MRRLLVHQTAGEVVDQWVEAAVGARQWQCDRVQSHGHFGQAAVLQQPHVRQRVQQQVDVIRDEAHEEDPQDPVNHGQGVSTAAKLAAGAGAVPRVAQHAQHLAVAVEQKQSGQQKGPQNHSQSSQDDGVVMGRGRIQQAGVLRAGGRRAEQRQAQADPQNQAPDPSAHQLRGAHPAVRQRQRVHHGEVAVHGDAHEEEDASVQADVFKYEGEVAVDHTRGPVGRVSRLWGRRSGLLVVKVDPQRQRGHEKQIGHRQADHVDGRAAHGAGGEAQPVQSHAVGDHGHQEDDAVGHLVEGVAVADVYGAVWQKRVPRSRLIGGVAQRHVFYTSTVV